MRLSTHAVVLIAPAVLAGCVTERTAYEWWYHPPSWDFHGTGPNNLEQVPAVAVTRDTPDALARLDKNPWVEITAAEAAKYAVEPVPGPSDRLFLLRAVSVKGNTGAFQVTRRKDVGDVRVVHRVSQRQKWGAVEDTRHALIVRLPGPPKDLFVDSDDSR